MKVRSSIRSACVLAALALALGSGGAHAQTCPVGTSGPGGMAPCTPCASGYFASVPGSSVCLPCGPGFSSTPGSTSCQPCEPGTANPFPGGQCLTCPVGKISATSGSTACQTCPAGTTSNETHTACITVAPAAGPWGNAAVALLIAGSGLMFVRRRQAA